MLEDGIFIPHEEKKSLGAKKMNEASSSLLLKGEPLLWKFLVFLSARPYPL